MHGHLAEHFSPTAKIIAIRAPADSPFERYRKRIKRRIMRLGPIVARIFAYPFVRTLPIAERGKSA